MRAAVAVAVTTKRNKKEGKKLKLKHLWVKVFKIEPRKICGRQPLKNLKFKFLNAVFHKSYSVHS